MIQICHRGVKKSQDGSHNHTVKALPPFNVCCDAHRKGKALITWLWLSSWLFCLRSSPLPLVNIPAMLLLVGLFLKMLHDMQKCNGQSVVKIRITNITLSLLKPLCSLILLSSGYNIFKPCSHCFPPKI